MAAVWLDGRDTTQDIALTAGQRYPVAFSVRDPDGDPLSYRWRVKAESTATQEGGDYEAPIKDIDGLVDAPSAHATVLTAPSEAGA